MNVFLATSLFSISSAAAALSGTGTGTGTVPTALEKRGLLSSVIAGLGTDATDVAKVLSAGLEAIENLVPTKTLSSFAEATSSLSSILGDVTNIVDAAPELILNGIRPADLESVVQGFSAGDNSLHNEHTQEPAHAVYPQAAEGDAPYSISEEALRGAIFLPNGFTYGAKPPVILFPGTGVAAGETYAFTYGRVLQDTAIADPLWINIPKSSLDDAQLTAEYAAYAINYIAGITSQNISIVTFSQGSLNVQWALKYWPSTRSVTSDFIALSPDYHGTVNAALLCPQFPALGCTPSILQQFDHSTFVQTLLADDGDSAFVPTTNIRSATDEVVEPQTGPNPSGVLNDVRGVGVANYLVQEVCPLLPAGTLVTHEGMVYNALAYALAIDALRNEGPGMVKRVDVEKVCAMFVAEGMSLDDLLAEEAGLVVLAVNFLTYSPKVVVEPQIAAYAA